MTLIINVHNYKYETESLVKLFYPCQKINIEYDNYNFNRDNIIITRIKKGLKYTYVLVIVKSNQSILKFNKKFLNYVSDYDLICKKNLGLGLYKTLSKLTNITPKWGIITGIRPVKRIFNYREQNMTDEEIFEHLQKEYLVDKSKIDLSLKTSDNQIETLKKSCENSFSLYVSIPFCPSRCSYCSFVSHSIEKTKKLIPEYIKNICNEIEYTAKIAKQINLKLRSIYIGGGTPTSLTAQDLFEITQCIKNNFMLSKKIEYTIEAGRSDTITKEKLQVVKNSGASRISINPQTFNNTVLNHIGRKHSAQDVINCYNMAKEMGFENINMDFIAGLPNDSLESFKTTINKVLELSPENITIHTLSIKRASSIFSENNFNSYFENNIISQMVDYGQTLLLNNGYLPYYLYRQKNTLENLENVGYSKKGFVCDYNIFMMEEIHTILAVGAAGVSKLVNQKTGLIKRIFNYKYPYEYNSNFDEIINRKNEVITFYEQNS